MTFDAYEDAERAATQLGNQPVEPPEAECDFLVKHIVTPETVGDFELDEDGNPPEENHTGRWHALKTIAWKAWINGKQYGDYIICDAEESNEKAFGVLEEQYRQVKQRLDA